MAISFNGIDPGRTASGVIGHLFGSILGATLAILGACLSSRRSVLTAMVPSVAGNALILTIAPIPG